MGVFNKTIIPLALVEYEMISYPTRPRGIIVNYMTKRREKYMIPTRHPPVSTDALAIVDFFLSHSALKSCRESWEHMVEASELDGITLDLWGVP